MLLISHHPRLLMADFLGAEALVLTRHFSVKSIELGNRYPRKLDPDGTTVITPGFEINYDRPFNLPDYWISFLRFAIAHYYDSMNLKAGYLHFGPRFQLNLTQKIQCMFGLGPTLYFRESWNRFPDYREDGFFTESENFMQGYQHKFLPAGDFDFQYALSSEIQLVWSIIPGLPDIITNSFGFRKDW